MISENVRYRHQSEFEDTSTVSPSPRQTSRLSTNKSMTKGAVKDDDFKFKKVNFKKTSRVLSMLTSRNSGYVDDREQSRNLAEQISLLSKDQKKYLAVTAIFDVRDKKEPQFNHSKEILR